MFKSVDMTYSMQPGRFWFYPTGLSCELGQFNPENGRSKCVSLDVKFTAWVLSAIVSLNENLIGYLAGQSTGSKLYIAIKLSLVEANENKVEKNS